MSIGVWALIGVLILALTGYLIYVWRDNGGISFRGLSEGLGRDTRNALHSARSYLIGHWARKEH